MVLSVAMKGGDKIKPALDKLEKDLAKPVTLKVGFLDGATYATGMSVAAVAMIQEYGATIAMPQRQTTVYRKMNAKGTKFLRKGRFVKKSQSNYQTTHIVPAHVVTIPPRPFFRTMIQKNQDSWGPTASKLLKDNNYNVLKVAGLMGQEIKGELQQSIRDLKDPPNAPSTIARKGKDSPLIDTGYMLSRVDFEVIS